MDDKNRGETHPVFRGRRHGHDSDAQVDPEGVDVEKAQKREEPDQVPALFPKRRLPIWAVDKEK